MSLKRKHFSQDDDNVDIKENCDKNLYLLTKLSLLQKETKGKELKLQKLKLVKKYKEDEGNSDLSILIKNWTEICEKSLEDLFQFVSESCHEKFELDRVAFLNQLGISPDLIEVNENFDYFKVK